MPLSKIHPKYPLPINQFNKTNLCQVLVQYGPFIFNISEDIAFKFKCESPIISLYFCNFLLLKSNLNDMQTIKIVFIINKTNLYQGQVQYKAFIFNISKDIALNMNLTPCSKAHFSYNGRTFETFGHLNQPCFNANH